MTHMDVALIDIAFDINPFRRHLCLGVFMNMMNGNTNQEPITPLLHS